jgi:alpha-glucosidase
MARYSLLIFALSVVNFSAALEWWEGGNFYQIYPRSYMDSDGNGIGDLLGIASKVPYLKEIGMDGVWLSPIMKSPQYDYGYDISDYKDINEQYGTLADFDKLLQACKDNGVRLILDLVPNHSSHLHQWFKNSENRVAGYENYYTWHPGHFDPIQGKRVPPNNWVSVFRFPAWTWSETRKQFYYHAFLKEQPDLNYRNPRVVEEMKEVMRFWLNRGVSGFRIDAVPFLFEINKDFNGQFVDEPLTGASCPNSDDYCYTQHIYTQDLDETFEMTYQWRSVADEYLNSTGGVRVLMTEAYTSLENMIRYR